jgi:hypothetical protein
MRLAFRAELCAVAGLLGLAVASRKPLGRSRNEGVPGSIPGVGFRKAPRRAGFSLRGWTALVEYVPNMSPERRITELPRVSRAWEDAGRARVRQRNCVSMRRVVFAAVGAGALVLAGCGSTGVTRHRAVNTASSARNVSVGCRHGKALNPALTASQIAAAKRLLATDPRFATILAAAGTGVSAVMRTVAANSWTNNDGSQLLGASMYVHLPRKSTIATDWPVMNYDQSERSCPPYTTRTLHFRASHVAGLMVTVDVARRAVVEIQPDQNAVISNVSR